MWFCEESKALLSVLRIPEDFYLKANDRLQPKRRINDSVSIWILQYVFSHKKEDRDGRKEWESK